MMPPLSGIRLASRVGCVLALLALLPASALAQGYPRLGLYGQLTGEGWPFAVSSGGPLDPVVLDQVARYDEVVLDANPISEYRPDIAQQLRARNPDIRLLAYVLGSMYWQVTNPDSLVHYPTRYCRLVRDLDGRLYNKRGGLFGFSNVNLAKKDATGRFIVAEGLADLFIDVIFDSGVWDGIFLDIFCEKLSWAQSSADSIDFVRAGYPNATAFDAAWKAAGDTLVSRLRRAGGENAVLVGNCGAGTRYTTMNGWMRENFPFQNGSNWHENMWRDPGGYMHDDARFRQPSSNWIFTAQSGPVHTTDTNLRKVRYGPGSASLANGYGVFGSPDRAVTTEPYHTYGYDEYAVNLATGVASPSILHTGWMGQPIGPAYTMIWAGGNPDAVVNADFETDVSQWTFQVFGGIGATVTRDPTTAARGGASVRVDGPTPGAGGYDASFYPTGSIPVAAGLNYSATFWAKASPPRTLEVTAFNIPQTRFITVGEQWKQYQVVFDGSASTTSKVRFNLGSFTGSVWLDDVHFQQGVTSIQRRDFQNGSVLVNPTLAPITVPLGPGYRRILGTMDPLVNDGQETTSQVVPSADARFLINRDLRAPSQVFDLRVQQP